MTNKLKPIPSWDTKIRTEQPNKIQYRKFHQILVVQPCKKKRRKKTGKVYVNRKYYCQKSTKAISRIWQKTEYKRECRAQWDAWGVRTVENKAGPWRDYHWNCHSCHIKWGIKHHLIMYNTRWNMKLGSKRIFYQNTMYSLLAICFQESLYRTGLVLWSYH